MASELFQSFGQGQPQQPTSPKDAAISMLKQKGIQIPDNIANNPQAILQHLMQSGTVPQNRLQMAQQMMRRMFNH